MKRKEIVRLFFVWTNTVQKALICPIKFQMYCKLLLFSFIFSFHINIFKRQSLFCEANLKVAIKIDQNCLFYNNYLTTILAYLKITYFLLLLKYDHASYLLISYEKYYVLVICATIIFYVLPTEILFGSRLSTASRNWNCTFW